MVKMVNGILTSLDKNSKGEVNAVLCMFIDWKQAYSRQCHTLGVESFLKIGAAFHYPTTNKLLSR